MSNPALTCGKNHCKWWLQVLLRERRISCHYPSCTIWTEKENPRSSSESFSPSLKVSQALRLLFPTCATILPGRPEQKEVLCAWHYLTRLPCIKYWTHLLHIVGRTGRGRMRTQGPRIQTLPFSAPATLP